MRDAQHSPSRRPIPSTPTNQSGLGAIIDTRVRNGNSSSVSKDNVTVPGDLNEPSCPLKQPSARPLPTSACTSSHNAPTAPVSAMISMPSVAMPPLLQNEASSTCVVPTTREKWAPDGNGGELPWDAASQVARNVTP